MGEKHGELRAPTLTWASAGPGQALSRKQPPPPSLQGAAPPLALAGARGPFCSRHCLPSPWLPWCSQPTSSPQHTNPLPTPWGDPRLHL